MGVSFQDHNRNDPELLIAPMPAIRAPRRGLSAIASLLAQARRAGTKELGRSGHLALWGCYDNEVGFWCPSTLLRTVSLSNGRSTITGAVVAALKRDPHGQYFTAFGECKLIPKKKIFLISLGCAKNLVDSENVLGLLKENDYSITSKLEEAEVAIVNTCGFIQSAVEESIDTILEVARRKERGELEGLYVMGCFVQRYGYKLRKEIPEVDGWLGTGEIHRIVDMLKGGAERSPSFLMSKPTQLADHTMARVQTTPFYSTYLKIAEGCSHRCSYCTIPRLRGPFRSRGLESLIIEAENMVSRGVKEINLIAQDTTMYGRDLEGDVHIEDLLERLVQIHGLRWIRILYGHPHRISDRLLELIDAEEKICPYLDVPLQHVNEKTLKTMGRGSDGENPWQLIERIRAKIHQVSLRTTMMVGFPGETDEIFNELYDFVRKAEFDHLGAFIFSPERGTPAARLAGLVEKAAAEERLDALMSLQTEISERKNERMVGRTLSVLVEGVSPETDLLLKGRTAGMAPDVDGQVLINKGKGVVGEIVPVRIKEAHVYDLVGEIPE